jgi:hypothetical protein
MAVPYIAKTRSKNVGYRNDGKYDVSLKIIISKGGVKTEKTEKYTIDKVASKYHAISSAKKQARDKYRSQGTVTFGTKPPTTTIKDASYQAEPTDWKLELVISPNPGPVLTGYSAAGETLAIAKWRARQALAKQYRTDPQRVVIFQVKITQRGGALASLAADTSDPSVWEDVLENLSTASDFTSTAADLMKFKKLASKISIVGFVINGIDLVNDCITLKDYVDQYKRANSDAARSDIARKMIGLGAKQLKVLATTVVPVLGYVDLGYTAISTAYSSMKKMKVDQKNMAKKAAYDKESWALKPTDERYETEWRWYANGGVKSDIMELRDLGVAL